MLPPPSDFIPKWIFAPKQFVLYPVFIVSTISDVVHGTGHQENGLHLAWMFILPVNTAMWYVLGGGIYVGLLTHMLTTLLSNNKHHNGAGVEKSAYTST